MAALETKGELFDLHKEAAVIKQIQLASSAKDRQKTVGRDVTNKWGQSSSAKRFDCSDELLL